MTISTIITGAFCYFGIHFLYLIPNLSPKRLKRSYEGYDNQNNQDRQDNFNNQGGYNCHNGYNGHNNHNGPNGHSKIKVMNPVYTKKLNLYVKWIDIKA